jgi:hypothetical protein
MPHAPSSSSPLIITRTALEGTQIIKLLRSSLRNSLQPPVNSSLLIFSSARSSRTPSVSSVPQFEGPSFKPHIGTAKIVRLLILHPILNTRQRRGKMKFWDEWWQAIPTINLLSGPLWMQFWFGRCTIGRLPTFRRNSVPSSSKVRSQKNGVLNHTAMTITKLPILFCYYCICTVT